MADTAGTWYVVKYMQDLRRREPRNVGVALRTPDRWEVRFFAEREQGEIDGRTARRLTLKKPVYEAWVDYYRRRFGEARDAEQILADQQHRRANFFIELGGHILEDVESWRGELDRLYASLVSDPTLADQEGGFDLRDAVEAVFRQASVEPTRSVVLQAAYRSGQTPASIKFDYEYVNGAKHLMDAVSLASPNALALAQSFESRTAAVRQAGLASHFVAFVSTEHSHHDLDEVMTPLEAVADVIDVDDQPQAVNQLREVFHLA